MKIWYMCSTDTCDRCLYAFSLKMLHFNEISDQLYNTRSTEQCAYLVKVVRLVVVVAAAAAAVAVAAAATAAAVLFR